MTTETGAEKIAFRANPSFTCAGVNWGVEYFRELLKEYSPIFVPNPGGFVHNNRLKGELEEDGARFVGSISDIPFYSEAANSMHGLSPLDVREFARRRVRLFDLSCPLVDNVHQRTIRAIEEAERQGKKAIIFYHCKDTNHPEPKAVLELAPSHIVPVTDRSVLEQYLPRADEMYFVDSQTTLNVQQGVAMIGEFRDKFTQLRGLPRAGVCFATSNRQSALDELIAQGIEMLTVFGSPQSSNTTELVKIGRKNGLSVEFLETAELLEESMVGSFNRVGIHGGASVLSDEGDKAMEKLREWGYKTGHLVGRTEPSTFSNKPKVYNFRSGQIPEDLIYLTRTY